MKRSDARAVSILLALSLALVSALAACTTTKLSTAPQAGKRLPETKGAVMPMVRISPGWLPPPKTSFCIWFRFMVTAKGAVENEQVVGGLRKGEADVSRYVQSAANTLSEYKYFPRKVDGKLVATPNVIQPYLSEPAKSKNEQVATAWSCNQPLLVTSRPVLVLAPAATAGSPVVAPGSNGPDGSQFAVRIKQMPAGAAAMHGSAMVKIRFCIDPTGSVANATPRGGDITAQTLALEALDAMPFTPRGSNSPPNVQGLLMRAPKVTGGGYQPMMSTSTLGVIGGHFTDVLPTTQPQWSCGLETWVNVFSRPKNGAIATIQRASIVTLSAHPPKS